MIAALTGAAAIFLLRFNLTETQYYCFLAACIPFAAILAALLEKPLTAPARGRVVDRSRGVLMLKFGNPEFRVQTSWDT